MGFFFFDGREIDGMESPIVLDAFFFFLVEGLLSHGDVDLLLLCTL